MSRKFLQDAAEAARIVAVGVWDRTPGAAIPVFGGAIIGAAIAALTLHTAALDAAQSFAAQAARAQLIHTGPATSAVVALMSAPKPAKGKRR